MKLEVSTRIGWMVCVIVASILVSSCTHFRAELKPSPPQNTPTQTVPIAIGAYFPEAFRKYEVTHEWSYAIGGREVYIFPVGTASTSLLQNAMQLVFATAPVVESISDPGRNITVRRVLGFVIARVHISIGRNFLGGFKKCLVEVSYRIRAYDMQPREELTWIVTGKAETQFSPSFSRPPPFVIRAVEMAMRDAAEKFVTSFHELPEVRRWLENLQHSAGQN